MTSVETEKLGSRTEWTGTPSTDAPRASRGPSISSSDRVTIGVRSLRQALGQLA